MHALYLAPPADFAGVDGIITNLAKEREPGIEIIKHTLSNVTSTVNNYGYCKIKLAIFLMVMILDNFMHPS